MPIVCGIRFRGSGKVYYFAPGDLAGLCGGDHVIVETARGREMGEVATEAHEVDDADIVGQLKPIVRRATTTDLLDAQRYHRQEAEAIEKCKEQVARFNLPMKLVNAEYSYDGSRLTFFFTSEQRVDFRELVRELARIFRVRIELRQIGVRDEAKSVGGIGKCGRPICCATWLNEFCPVSIRMAKQQDLPLSPMEISGLCGRLLCCLGYENQYYQSVKGRFPKVGKIVSTPMGPAKVTRVSVLRETVELLFEDGSTAELTDDELAGRVPLRAEGEGELSDDQARALEDVLNADAGADDNGRGPRGAGERAAASASAGTAAPPPPDAAEGSPGSRRPPRRAGSSGAQGSPPGGDGAQPQEQGAAASSSTSSRSRRRRSRRPRSDGSSQAQAEPGQAPDKAAGDDQGQQAQPSRRRPRRRRSRKPGGQQGGGAPAEG